MEQEIRRTRSTDEARSPTVIETTKARQAVAPGHLRYVLTISIVLVVVAFAIVYLTVA